MLLELALQRYAVELLMAEGFTPTITPDLARNEILQGTGYIPRGPETQIYSIADSDLSLVATAEITLGGLLCRRNPRGRPAADQAVRHQPLLPHRGRRRTAGPPAGCTACTSSPRSRCSPSRCPTRARRCSTISASWSAGSSTAWAFAYRVVDTATGDLGGPAYRKFDLEAWMPGRGEAGEFGEVTSTSNCTDYQARRLGIRYRTGRKRDALVHTLNGTAIAISRALIAILENYQREDGTVTVPDALRTWLGKDRLTAPLSALSQRG